MNPYKELDLISCPMCYSKRFVLGIGNKSDGCPCCGKSREIEYGHLVFCYNCNTTTDTYDTPSEALLAFVNMND